MTHRVLHMAGGASPRSQVVLQFTSSAAFLQLMNPAKVISATAHISPKEANPPGFGAAAPRIVRTSLKLITAVWLFQAMLPNAEASGTWTPCRSAPATFRSLLLLSDSTVMAAAVPFNSNAGNSWYRLTPDSTGSYVNGTWSRLASMHDSRRAYSSAVLRDGRVFVAGGEYGTGIASAEVYDPLSDTWTMAPPSGQSFVDSICKILPGGEILVAPVFPNVCGRTVIYHPDDNTWSAGPVLLNSCYQDEASWVKLPDQSILTVDPFGTNTERYIPAINQWVNDTDTPVELYDSTGEIGAALLLPDGRAFFLGGTGHTAFYTPTGTASPGTWAAGPDIPNGQGTSDAPAAMMVNGKILCVVGPAASANGPSSFYEYDPVANSFTQVSGPTGLTDNLIPQETTLLDLPDGTVLYSDDDFVLYVYRPDGLPLTNAPPTIQSILTNADGSYHLTGTELNGNSEGAAYGDDVQMDSNYPLVRLTDAAGHVYYARTYNWSSTGVMTGTAPQTTEFVVPPGVPSGTYSLVVVVNGISSAAVPFTIDALRITPSAALAVSGPAGGSFSPISQQLSLSNAGTDSLNWTTGDLPPWLTVSPATGTLAPAASTSVTITLNSQANGLGAGTFAGEVWFTNLNTGFALERNLNLTVSSPAVLQPYANTIQLFNPVAYWRLDETNQPVSAGVATNLGTLLTTGNGSFSGVLAWISGPLAASVKTATSFEGISSVTVPYSHSLSQNAPFSVEGWVQPSTVQTDGNVMCPLACGHFDTSRSGWLIYQTATGWNFRMYNQNQLNTSLDIEAGQAPVPGRWYHIAAVYDGSQASIYVNGSGVSGKPTGFVPNTDGPFTIGERSDDAFGFAGAIGEVALYTNAFATNTVLAHYQNGTNFSGAAVYEQLILSSNPLVYLHLDAPFVLPTAANSGILASNADGFYQLGTIPGIKGPPVPGLGGVNRACQFNGAAGYVNVPGDFLDFTNSLSVIAWVRGSPANGVLQSILSKGENSYRFEMNENGYPQFADGLDNPPVIGPRRIDDGRWHQLIGIYDPAGTNYLYVDATLAGFTNAPASPGGTDNDLRLGGAPAAGTIRNFSGALDEVALFTNVLSAQQIQQLYLTATNSAALSPQPPVVQSSGQSNQSLLCTWSAFPGLRYQVQFSTNFIHPTWLGLGSTITATDSVLSIALPIGPEPQRFYRSVLLP